MPWSSERLILSDGQLNPGNASIPPTAMSIHRQLTLMSYGLLATLATTIKVSAQDAATTPPAPPPPPPTNWVGSVALGLTLTSGNSDTLMVTLTGRADKKWDANEISLGLDASYGEDEDVKNNETLRAFGQYNRLFTDRWYGYFRAEAFHDDIADIDYRFTLSPGVGYYFIKEADTLFSAEVGPGFIYEKQGGDTTGYFTVRLAEKFEHKFNDRVRVWQSAEFLPQVDDFDNFIVNAEVGVESALSKALSLRVVLQDTYDNRPAPDRDENDLRLITGVVWKF
jgi:putative salt-induced outer membrane protein